jgi:hypothetical protein
MAGTYKHEYTTFLSKQVAQTLTQTLHLLFITKQLHKTNDNNDFISNSTNYAIDLNANMNPTVNTATRTLTPVAEVSVNGKP